ncbi:hypothetical protein FHW36_102243 [Chitinophaga polysaccharea]|uniref:Uncharacterized protein n=1 Tax=Chitinophaga polysaccharea TaxID=1293035 RepID=A0A561PWL7_9BACT|nr:hypothetical protein [Chitinophaga polysaccharea]TWF42487.1 hypothetical protein FHW36_102243 [Chitinophaga polysaccharea]
MRKLTLFLALCAGLLSQQTKAQIGSYDTIYLNKTYRNNIFSSVYSANFRSGLNFQTGASINSAISNFLDRGFQFRWLANDVAVDFTTDRDLIMKLTPVGDLSVKKSLNAPLLTVGSATDSNYYKLVIVGPNSPYGPDSRRDLSYEFAGAGKAVVRSYRGGSWDTYLQFLTSGINNTGGEPSVRMHIGEDGNVGIGTTAPANHLQLATSAANNPNIFSIVNTGVANSQMFIGNTTSNYVVTNQRDGNIVESYRDLHVSAANAGNIYFETARGGNTAPVRMTILNDGSVGIGTATTGTNKLAVEGTIAARKVKVTAANPWPDYVFHEGYQLPHLKDLAHYIAQHKHLPGIPDAAAIQQEGQDLGEMNRKLLEKVEELTLYIIEQHKRNDEQQVQIDMLLKQLKH